VHCHRSYEQQIIKVSFGRSPRKHQRRGNGGQTGEFSKDAASDRAPNLRSAATSLHCHQVDNCALFGCATSR
jgi:hypothetical protein